MPFKGDNKKSRKETRLDISPSAANTQINIEYQNLAENNI